MAKRHGRDDAEQDDITTDADGQDRATEPVGSDEAESPTCGRRTLVKAASATVAAGALSGLIGNAAATEAGTYLDQNGDVTVPAGQYSWDGDGLGISSGESVVGEGSNGDVVFDLESGTMDGYVQGTLENIVVRGSNHDPKAGIDLHPGATVDGFVWPEGGQQSEDRAFYSPQGGDDRVTVRNSAWGMMVNNGAYIDKPPVTMENCAAVNNNIANIRVGHRDGTPWGETTYIRNCIVAVTQDIGHDDTNVPHSRGIRLRHPADLVIENCWFIYLDVDGTADLIELHDGAAGSTVTIRNCAFYNDSNRDLVRDKSSGQMDVTIENCTFSGSGSREVDPSYSGSGIVVDDSVDFPLPSAVTGYAVADEIPGVGEGIGPWGSSTTTSTEEETTTDTLVLHASPDNSRDVDISFTVDGSIDYAEESESDTDTIVDNGDGTVTATSVALDPDALDSYYVSGQLVDYDLPDDAVVDISLNGATTTFSELVEEESTDSTETSTDSTDDSTTDSTDTSTDSTETSTDSSTDSTETSTDSSTDSTETSTDSTETSTDDSANDSSDNSTSGSLPHMVTVTGDGNDGTTYTFTVSGDVIRDAEASEVTDDGTDWDEMQDIARDGKVIGLVGSGVDAYRFSGNVESVTTDGEADLNIQRNVR